MSNYRMFTVAFKVTLIIPIVADKADSTGRRNTGIILLSEELIEHLDGCFPSERFAWPRVHRVSDGGQLLG